MNIQTTFSFSLAPYYDSGLEDLGDLLENGRGGEGGGR
jgi:hypothetical protein